MCAYTEVNQTELYLSTERLSQEKSQLHSKGTTSESNSQSLPLAWSPAHHSLSVFLTSQLVTWGGGHHCLSVCVSHYLGISLKDHIAGRPSLPWSADSLGISGLQFQLPPSQSLADKEEMMVTLVSYFAAILAPFSMPSFHSSSLGYSGGGWGKVLQVARRMLETGGWCPVHWPHSLLHQVWALTVLTCV